MDFSPIICETLNSFIFLLFFLIVAPSMWCTCNWKFMIVIVGTLFICASISGIYGLVASRGARARAHIRSFVHAMEMPDDRRQHMDARCAAYSVYLFLTINCSNDIFVKYALQSKCINIYILCDLALCVLCLYITEKEINHISMFIRCMMPACLPPCSQKKQHCVRMG